MPPTADITDRKKPGVAFWATVIVVVVLVAYPLSFGPACWLIWNVELSQPVLNFLDAFYDPLEWSQTTFDWADWYGHLLIDETRPRANAG